MPTKAALTAKEQELLPKWKEKYDYLGSKPDLSEEDKKEGAEGSLVDELEYESLCIGWCLAQGLSLDEGYNFYQKMVDYDLY